MSFHTIIQTLKDKAINSCLTQRLAACLKKGNRMISHPYCNIQRNKYKGHYCGSLHAETNAIINYYGNKLSFNKKSGWYFDESSERNSKSKKLDLFVIRVNMSNKLCNSRPCFNCLNLMKVVGINKVYYSVDNGEIVSEHVKNMVSIQASSTTIQMYRIKCKIMITIDDYFNNLLLTLLPQYIKKENFDCFVKYNLVNIFPTYKYIISSKGIITIQNDCDKVITTACIF